MSVQHAESNMQHPATTNLMRLTGKKRNTTQGRWYATHLRAVLLPRKQIKETLGKWEQDPSRWIQQLQDTRARIITPRAKIASSTPPLAVALFDLFSSFSL